VHRTSSRWQRSPRTCAAWPSSPRNHLPLQACVSGKRQAGSELYSGRQRPSTQAAAPNGASGKTGIAVVFKIFDRRPLLLLSATSATKSAKTGNWLLRPSPGSADGFFTWAQLPGVGGRARAGQPETLGAPDTSLDEGRFLTTVAAIRSAERSALSCVQV
jgi:hypothetical protein